MLKVLIIAIATLGVIGTISTNDLLSAIISFSTFILILILVYKNSLDVSDIPQGTTADNHPKQ